jgi:DNA-binding HxlR family transcriptional regulator
MKTPMGLKYHRFVSVIAKGSLPQMMPAGRADYDKNRYVEALGSIGRPPNTSILRALADGPRRFNELIVELGAVPEPVLSAGLRELDADGLVTRRVDPGPPLRVLYELTVAAVELGPALRALSAWCDRKP